MIDILRRSSLVLLLWVCAAALSAQMPLIKAKHLTWTVLYNYERMSPEVVYYILDESDFRGSISTKPKYFKMDTKLPPPRVSNKDLQKTGYERGHLCPAGDRDGRKDWLKDTYFTSNVVLMTTATNAGVWRETELLCRRLAVGGHRLFIASGPVWYHPTAVSNTIPDGLSSRYYKKEASRKPPYLFKVCSCLAHQGETLAWLIPNGDAWVNEKDCRVPLDSLVHGVQLTVLNSLGSWINQ